MAAKRRRAGEHNPARHLTETNAVPLAERQEREHSVPEMGEPAISAASPPRTGADEQSLRKETNVTPTYGFRGQGQQTEGVTVTGEAVRRLTPETAEFVVEITANGGSAAQALRDHNTKMQQIAQAAAPLGVQRTDIQTASMNVCNLYSPLAPALPGYGAMPQIGAASVGSFGSLQPGGMGLQPDVQFGSYQARSLLRVTVRDPARVGEVVDTITRAGANVIGSFSFRVSDEASARRTALEAAGRDARAKAEILAQAAGKQVGDAVSISEDIVVSNGAYAALRAANPFAFGTTAPHDVAGELEYYARVSASFRFQ